MEVPPHAPWGRKPEKLSSWAHKLPDGSQGTFQLNGLRKIIRHYSLKSSGSRSMPEKKLVKNAKKDKNDFT